MWVGVVCFRFEVGTPIFCGLDGHPWAKPAGLVPANHLCTDLHGDVPANHVYCLFVGVPAD